MNGRNNVEVRNGTIRGFYLGICEQNVAGTRHRIINIRASGNGYGIGLYGNKHVVKNCICSDNLSTGIYVDGAGTVTDCVASNNNRGIEFFGPGNVLGNTACSNSINFWIGHNVATSIMVDRNSAFGQNPNYYIPSGTTGVVGLATGTTMNAGAP